MSGIDEIISQILSEAESAAAQTVEQAQLAAQKTLEDYREKAAAQKAALADAQQRDFSAERTRAESAAQLAARNAVLQTKTTLIAACVDAVRERLRTGWAGEYRALFLRFFNESLTGGDATLRMDASGEQASAFWESALALARERYPNAALRLAEDTKVTGGFVLEYGEITAPCTADDVVEFYRDALEAKANEVLFGEGKV